MNTEKQVIIFSHGFGVSKEARGLFTEIANAFTGIKTVLFNYNKVDRKNNTITVKPFLEQVKILKRILKKQRAKNPKAVINLICHSQGSRIVAMANLPNIHKIILIAPSIDVGYEKMLARYKDNPKTEINFDGITKLARTDGSITLVPPKYWQERKNEPMPIILYNQLSKNAKVFIIKAKNDTILGKKSFKGLDKKIKVIELKGDHDFKDNRENLIKKIKEIIYNI